MTISRIKKVPLHEAVYNSLKESILSGTMKPGQKLNQLELANEMAISRMPIRDALRILETEKLIEYHKNIGYVISEFPEERIKDIITIRRILEPEAVRMSEGKITSDDLDIMDNLIVDSQDALIAGDFSKVRDLNYKFHFTIYNRTNSPTIVEFIDKLWHSYPKNLYHNIDEFEKRTISQNVHQKIVKELRDGNFSNAALLMKNHISLAFESESKQ